jgi:ribosome biogenesis GTPase A
MKKSLENFAREVAAVASEWAVDMPLNLVERVTRQVEHFDIAVIGHYNAGKSTLLNTVLALPENDCLPVGPLPTTRLPWKLVFGSDRMIRGYRENGSEAFSSGLDEINSPEFAALCEGYDDMTFIQASIESQMLALPGLAIWDTPGITNACAYCFL